MKLIGRKEIPVDWNRFHDLVIAGCTMKEIAAFFGMSDETLRVHCNKKLGITFTEYASHHRAKGWALVREHQFKKAIGETRKGDNQLLIWLGKNWLNQRDTSIEFQVSEDVTLSFEQVMAQLAKLQSERKIATKMEISADKSECETGKGEAKEGIEL